MTGPGQCVGCVCMERDVAHSHGAGVKLCPCALALHLHLSQH